MTRCGSGGEHTARGLPGGAGRDAARAADGAATSGADGFALGCIAVYLPAGILMADPAIYGATRGETASYRGGEFNRVEAQALQAFASPMNIASLRAWLSARAPAAAPGVESAAASFAAVRAREVLEGGAPVANSAAALHRLNRAFVGERLTIIPDPAGADSEQYANRMFAADSLRPPGLEQLNTAGPLWGARFDETEDSAWDAAGDPRADAADRLGEYYGEDGGMGGVVRAAGAAPVPRFGGENQYGRREAPSESAAFRIKGIPFWQKAGGGVAGVSPYIGDTLGSGPRELGGQVRGWPAVGGRNDLKRGPYMV